MKRALLLLLLVVPLTGCALLPHIASIGLAALARPKTCDTVPDGTPVACWDTNRNGVFDPEEDMDGDGIPTIWDCRIMWDEYSQPDPGALEPIEPWVIPKWY